MDFNPWAVENVEVFHYYCCPECEQRYQNRQEFEKHAVIHHPKAKTLFHEPTKSEVKDELDWFEETSVETEFQTEEEELKKFKCDECDFVTHTAKNLTQHVFVRHRKDEHKFICADCEKKFPTKFLLKQHVEITHKGLNKRHMCDRCGKAFAYKNGIKDHACRPGHVQKDVQCDKCDHVFKREMDYLQHHKSQHGGFPAHLEHRVKYLCDQCPAAYTTYVGLYLHKRKNHNAQGKTNQPKAPR